MPSSKVEICNIALTYLGMESITDINEATEQARRLNVIYNPSLRSLLEAHPWKFATMRANLAKLTETPINVYTNLFALPSEIIRILRLSDPDISYRIEGGKLATDASEVEIEYIGFVENPNQYAPSFVEAFAAKLAYELSISITDKEGLMDRFEKMFQVRLSKAVFNDSQQGTPAALTRNPWIEERHK